MSDIRGLPTLNAYPLNKEIDVQVAVHYFYLCPLNKRLELSNNINKRLRELDHRVICPDNVKAYIDKSYVASYEEHVDTFARCASMLDSDAKSLKINLGMSMVVLTKNINILNISEKREYIKKIINDKKLWDIINTSKHIELTSFTDVLADFVRRFDEIDETIHEFVFTRNPFHNEDCSFKAGDALSAFINSMQTNKCSREFFLERIQIIIRSLNKLRMSVTTLLLHAISLEREIYGNSLLFDFFITSDKDSDFNVSVAEWYGGLFEYSETERFLNTSISKCQNNINYLQMGKQCAPAIKSFNQYYKENKLFKYDPVFNMLNVNTIAKYIETFSFSLSKVQLMMLQNSKKFTDLYQWFMGIDDCFVGKTGDDLFVLGFAKSNPKELLAFRMEDISESLFRGHNPEYILPVKRLNFDKSTYVTEAFTIDTDIDSITEGINVSADGDVTFTFSPKKTFMDQYAENHRHLVTNFKNANYEGVKTNLAFLFAMISVIERDYIFNDKKIKGKKLDDVKKARTFAYNDFNTYIKELQKVERGFDFTSYYHEQGYDKLTFTVTQDNVKGIRKLFNQIMLGQYLKV